MYSLEFYQEQGLKVCSISLEASVTVGRAANNDVTLSDKSISRYHATFLVERNSTGSTVMVRDEGSTNGVVVNGEVVQSESVPIGLEDQILIGPFRVVLHEAQISAQPADIPDEGKTTMLENVLAPWDSISVERLRVLYEFECTDPPADIDGLIRVTVNNIRTCVSFSSLCIVLNDEKGNATSSLWNEKGHADSTVAPANAEVLEQCESSSRVVVISNKPGSVPRTIDNSMCFDFLVSTACIPLIGHRNEKLGAIYVQSDSQTRYGSEDLKFLYLVSKTFAATIERRRTEAKLVKAKEKAEASNVAKSEFLANMSHELRTPLHSILSYARFGRKKIEKAPKAKLLEYYEIIEKSGQCLLDLVDGLLDLAKLDAGKMVYNVGSVDLASVVESLGTELSLVIKEKGLRFQFQPPSADVTCIADHTRVTQAVRNILSNAIKFSESGKAVAVSIDEGELDQATGSLPALIVSVSDEGVGIPEDEIECIFEKFTQSSITNDGSGGTGLGLAICKEIVLAHGGWIKAERRQGCCGTIVRFALPRRPPASALCFANNSREMTAFAPVNVG